MTLRSYTMCAQNKCEHLFSCTTSPRRCCASTRARTHRDRYTTGGCAMRSRNRESLLWVYTTDCASCCKGAVSEFPFPRWSGSRRIAAAEAVADLACCNVTPCVDPPALRT